MARIAVTWKKSTIGAPRAQRATIASLGLKRLHQTVVHEDTPSFRGMVQKVRHLVNLERLSSTETSGKSESNGQNHETE